MGLTLALIQTPTYKHEQALGYSQKHLPPPTLMHAYTQIQTQNRMSLHILMTLANMLRIIMCFIQNKTKDTILTVKLFALLLTPLNKAIGA